MKRKRRAGAPTSATWLAALVCLALGAVGGWGARGIARDRQSAAGLPRLSESHQAEAELARMGAGELRGEVRRLRAACDDKDRQIAELTIQLTIATKGTKAR